MSAHPLADALHRIAPASSATSVERAAAWSRINEAVRQHWFEQHPQRYGANDDLVEDIRQTVLVRLVAGKALFGGTSDGEAVNFLKATARNATVDTLRRRRFEERLTDEHVDRLAGGAAPDEHLLAEELSARLSQVIDHATGLRKSPKRPTLERHLREAVYGQAPADASPDADLKEAARLRQERSRSLALLRLGHDDLMAQDVNEDVDRIIRAILASPRTLTSDAE